MPFPPRYLVFSVILIIPVILAGTLYTSYEGSHPAVTVIGLDGAPDRMVFVSDPHIRPANLENVKELIRQINDLHPSVVFIAGDFVVGDESDPALQEVWGELESPAYAVLGNHDYRAGIEAEGPGAGRLAWVLEILLRARGMNTSSYYAGGPDLEAADKLAQRLESNGIIVLRNEAVEISHEGKTAVIVGVDDIWAGKSDPPKVNSSTGPVIYLVHEPAVYPDWNADLVLSGHTHGGQFNNPLFTLINAFGLADIEGFHQKGNSTLFVSRGTGTSAFGSDRRFLEPPEIVLINPGD